MNQLLPNLRSKRSPGGKLQERSYAGLGQRLGHPTLNRRNESSNLSACTMKHATAAVGVVVMPAHPCGEQQGYVRRLSSAVEQRTYTPRVIGSNPVAGTICMRSAASKSRQLSHAGGAHMDVRLFHTQQVIGSNPMVGTPPRRRMVLVRLCRRGLTEGHPVSTWIYAGSSPAAGAMENVRIQSSRIRICAGRLNGIKQSAYNR